MRYDDRLSTVLRLTPVGQNVARIQFRQLLDLLGTSPAEATGALVDAAYLRLAELCARIPAADRLGMMGRAGSRLRSARLVATLAALDPAMGRAAIAHAQLSPEEWADLVPALPSSVRPAMLARGDIGADASALLGRLGVSAAGLPAPEAPQPAASQAPPPPAAAPTPAAPPPPARPRAGHEIGAVVERIAAFRRQRQAAGESPPLPLGLPAAEEPPARAPVAMFDFASDAEGRIVWSDGEVAAMIVGHNLAEADMVNEAIRFHQPLRALPLVLAGAPAIAGRWQVDAAARFDPAGGRFVGYLGRMRRLPEQAAALPPDPAPQADRIRQLLHELRTPVNAIQGFAEIIQQQLFGPVPHEYRALAAHIAADSARMLAGFEELERFAKLESGAIEITGGEGDLVAAVRATLDQLAAHTTPRGSQLALTLHETPPPVAMAPIEIERLCWRLLATLAAQMAPGELCGLEIGVLEGGAVLVAQLPAALARLDDAALFGAIATPAEQTPSAGMFGSGFALRLAAAEARSAGGWLERHEGLLELRLPGLKAAAPAAPAAQAPPSPFAAPAA